MKHSPQAISRERPRVFFFVVFFNADSPHLEQPEIFLLLQTVINILLPPRIISTSRTKNFMLDASPAHCSTPGDTGKDLRREGLAESTSQAAYLGTTETPSPPSLLSLPPLIRFLLLAALKVVLVCFERSLGNQWYRLSLQVKEMALRKVGGLAFWDFIDFIVRTRIPIFVLLRPFIQCKVSKRRAPSAARVPRRPSHWSVFRFPAVVDPAGRLPGGDNGAPPHRRPAGETLHPASPLQELPVCGVQQRAQDPEGGRAQRLGSGAFDWTKKTPMSSF